MKVQKSYMLERRSYPVCILGGDKFCDWFAVVPPPARLTTEYAFEMMKASYDLGVRGFDISCRYNLIEAFRQLKSIYPDAIGIGNPNWKGGYKLGSEHLWDVKDRVISTIIYYSKCGTGMSAETHHFEKYLNQGATILTKPEIKNIRIDESIWLDRLKQLRGLVDFCLIGADYADWMCGLDRLDLLRWQIAAVRSSGMIPVSVSHWADVTIPLLDQEDFAAHWIYADRNGMFMNHESAVDAVRGASKPITAFKILGQGRLAANIVPNISWLKSLGVKSFLFGLDNLQHMQELWPIITKTASSI